MKFKNLRAELARNQISIAEVCRVLGVSRGTVFGKFAGRTDWRLTEVKQIVELIHERSGKRYSVEYLFGI